MGLSELLLQKSFRPGELGREAVGDALQRGLRAAFLDLDREDGLVELRMTGVVQRVLDIRILQEGGDQRIDDGVVRVQDLNPNRVLLFLEEPHLHGRARSGSADLRFCGSPLLRSTRGIIGGRNAARSDIPYAFVVALGYIALHLTSAAYETPPAWAMIRRSGKQLPPGISPYGH